MNPTPTPQATDVQIRRAKDQGQSAYAALNAFLNKVDEPVEFSEDDLAHWFRHIEDDSSGHHYPVHWLCLARLTEAALLTAAARADRADFRGATDFLANPRRINVHYLKTSRFVRKKRHMPLSEQFARPGLTPQETLHQMSQETMLHIAEEALLPSLYQRLEVSTHTKHTYLSSLKKRMERVAETLNFLACDRIFNPQDLQTKLYRLSAQKREWYRSQLCNFPPSWFWHLGRAVSYYLGNFALQDLSTR